MGESQKHKKSMTKKNAKKPGKRNTSTLTNVRKCAKPITWLWGTLFQMVSEMTDNTRAIWTNGILPPYLLF